MAKLEGVKVIEATIGGEITKVAYDGAEYALVSGNGKVGDLAQCNRNHSYFTKGEFYEVTELSSGGEYVHAIDDEGDRYFMGVEKTAKLFRKIEEASELTTKFNVGDVVVTLEKCGWTKIGQDLMKVGAVGKVKAVEGDKLTVKFNKHQPTPNATKQARKNFVVRTSEVRLATAEEAATIAKKKKRLTVGDYAEVIAKDSGHGASIGDIVHIVTDEHDDQPYECERVSNGENVGWFYESELKRADKPSQSDEIITFEGEQYRKVDRKAQAGDVVVFTENTSLCVKSDKPYLVEISRGEIVVDGGGRDFYSVYFDHYGRTPETVDVYEKVEAGVKPFKKGDIVVITANTNSSRNAVGDIGKIAGVVRSSDSVRVDVPSKPSTPLNNGNYTKLDEMRHATAEEIAQYEAEVAPKQSSYVPQEGDIVVIKSLEKRASQNASVRVGDIGKVGEQGVVCPEGSKILVPGRNQDVCYVDLSEVRKATPAEVAAYEKAVADASKPKLKAGDFVKITRELPHYNNDKIYEVIERTQGLGVIDEDGDFNCGAINGGEYEILSAEEVAKHADEAKWAKIGRKPGEFKKGDIARVLAHADGRKVGEIGIVEDGGVLGESGIGIRFNDDAYVGICWSNEDAELIAPVDARFDK